MGMRDESVFPGYREEVDADPNHPMGGSGHVYKVLIPGITKRELFAAMAMMGSMARNRTGEDAIKAAVILADALLAELSKDRE